jgi:hypothetical protein
MGTHQISSSEITFGSQQAHIKDAARANYAEYNL